jgi:uncharacterized Zn finger protein
MPLGAARCSLLIWVGMRINLECAECGGNRFALDEAETDSCVIRCSDCGHEIGTLAELKERVAAEVIRGSVGDSAPA